MAAIKTLSIQDVEHLVEQKLLELLGDPESGLALNPKFLKNLKVRIKKNQQKISHKKIMEKYG